MILYLHRDGGKTSVILLHVFLCTGTYEKGFRSKEVKFPNRRQQTFTTVQQVPLTTKKIS